VIIGLPLREKCSENSMKRKCRILLVEDDPVLGPMMAQARAHFDHECVLVTTADAARECLSQPGRFDAVLLDLQLNGHRSEPVVEELREKGLKLPPIVVLSAQPVDEIQKAVKKVRAKAYLQKPAALEEIEAIVRRAVA
jgi:DNA-binding response OmpR family regulator